MIFRHTLLLSLLLSILLTIASCGSKKSTVPVKLKLFQSAITSGEASAGGLLFMGKSEDGQHSFRMGLDNSESLSLDLMKGKWEFAAIAWEGGAGGKMMGVNRCAKSGIVDLKDSEATVSFNLTQANCTGSFAGKNFSETYYMSSASPGLFLPFYVIPCFDNSVLTMSSCNTSANPSSLTHYKIVFKAQQKGDVVGSMSSLVSGCFRVMYSPYPTVPMTLAGADNSLGFSIELYKTDSCSDAPLVYDFRQGPLNNFLTFNHNFNLDLNGFTSFFVNPGVLYNKTVPNTYGITSFLTNAVMGNDSQLYTQTQTINYTIAGTPSASAVEMCVTESSSCLQSEWQPIGVSGTYTMSNTVGAHLIKLFYRNSNGDVSPYKSVNVNTFLPSVLYFSSVVSAPSYLSFEWNGVANQNLIMTSRFQICNNSSCSIVYYEDLGPLALSTSAYQIIPSKIKISMVPGANYYAVLSMVDIFGLTSTVVWMNAALSYNYNMP
jgi:hypothetical protein